MTLLEELNNLTKQVLYSHKSSQLNMGLNLNNVGFVGALNNGEAPFSPLDLTSLHAWYDASDITTITKDGSDRVSQWDDKSGNGHHLVQATGGEQPLWLSADRNSLDVIHFDQDARNMAVNWSAISQPVTIYVVVLLPANTAGADAIYDAESDTAFAFLKQPTNNKFDLISASAITFTETGLVSTWRYVTNIHNTTSSSMRFNGVEKVSGDAGTSTMTGITLSQNRSGISQSVIKIGEVIVQDALASAQELSDTETYLSDKWGF